MRHAAASALQDKADGLNVAHIAYACGVDIISTIPSWKSAMRCSSRVSA